MIRIEGPICGVEPANGECFPDAERKVVNRQDKELNSLRGNEWREEDCELCREAHGGSELEVNELLGADLAEQKN